MATAKSLKEDRAIEGAAEVFTRYGYARTTMADIAAKAGMSRPALYLLFPDKDAVFARVVEQMDGRKLHEIVAALAGLKTLEEKLLYACLDWGLHGAELAAAHPDAADLFNLRFPVVRQVYVNFEALVTELISEAVETSGIGITALELARTLVYGMRGLREAAADIQATRGLITVQVKILIRALR